MVKKSLPIIAGVLLIGAITTTTLLFIFPYDPLQPPILDDGGSTPQGMLDVANANNQFALDVYFQFDETVEGNMFYSPYSIFSALAMTYEGATGQTRDEMQSVFHFPEEEVLRPNYAAIYNEINARRKKYELRTGNALWVQNDFPLQEGYVTTVEDCYGGKVANVDFVNEAEKSRQTINDFIDEQTNHKISDVIPPGHLSALTRLVLTNAIYFNGDWEEQFDPSKTEDKDFTIDQETVIQVPMMEMQPDYETFNYALIDGLQMIELPYEGGKISMLILLPAENLEAINTSLTAEKLVEYRNQMQKTELKAISLPKFEFDTNYLMKETLISLGMPTAFSENANFTGMTLAGDLSIDNVVHQAFVKVDERGTEAAAATAVSMSLTALPPPKPTFNANHPFLFAIQENETGTILFLGRVTDPTAE